MHMRPYVLTAALRLMAYLSLNSLWLPRTVLGLPLFPISLSGRWVSNTPIC